MTETRGNFCRSVLPTLPTHTHTHTPEAESVIPVFLLRSINGSNEANRSYDKRDDENFQRGWSLLKAYLCRGGR